MESSTIMSELNTQFVTELQALLKKYNASISWNCGAGSDLHGVYEERMDIEINNNVILTVPWTSYVSADNIQKALNE
jgi:hypothetical protein